MNALPNTILATEKPEQPTLANVFRRFGPAFLQKDLPRDQAKALGAILCCRTAALGGYAITCDDCDEVDVAFCSCRNRHCPTCQAYAQGQWIAKRKERVLPVGHFHAVFTLPAELRELAFRNRRLVFSAMFAAAAETLLKLSTSHLGGQPGITLVLHTWTRTLLFHPHIHAIVTGGAWNGHTWNASNPTFLFPIQPMAMLFRGILMERLRNAEDLVLPDGVTSIIDLLRTLGKKKWIVYIKEPFGSVDSVILYLGQYTHRVGISNRRLIAVTDDKVTFHTRDGQRQTVTGEEFVRRFLLHVLPDGLHKIRHYGLYSGANVGGKLEDARRAIPPPKKKRPPAEPTDQAPKLSHTCPACGGQRHLVPIPPGNPNASFAWKRMYTDVLRRWEAGGAGGGEGPPPDTP